MYGVFQSKYLKHMEMLVEMNILSGCKLPVQAIPSDSTEINEFNDQSFMVKLKIKHIGLHIKAKSGFHVEIIVPDIKCWQEHTEVSSDIKHNQCSWDVN